MLSLPPLRIPHPHPTLPQSSVHRSRVDIELLTDPGERPRLAIQSHGVIDLLGRQAASPHHDSMSTHNVADRLPIDPKLCPEFIHRGSSLVVLDQFLYLGRLKPPSSPWQSSSCWPEARWSLKVWQLLEQGFQDTSLLPRVRVSSPGVHLRVLTAVDLRF